MYTSGANFASSTGFTPSHNGRLNDVIIKVIQAYRACPFIQTGSEMIAVIKADALADVLFDLQCQARLHAHKHVLLRVLIKYLDYSYTTL